MPARSLVRALLTSLVAVATAASCDEWPGLSGNNSGGVSGAGRIEDTSGGLGSSCDSTTTCNAGLTCQSGLPGGMCTKSCASDADCLGGVCVLTQLICYKACSTDDVCRSSYSCQPSGTASACLPGSSSADAGADR